jgi:hypothetical protein
LYAGTPWIVSWAVLIGYRRPFVAGIEDVLEEDVADRIFPVGGADDGDGLGFKQCGEVVMF